VKQPRRFLAFDLGAESGRAILGELDCSRLSVRVVSRFPNRMLELSGHLFWDVWHLLNEVKNGLRACAAEEPTSVGVDTWGVFFGLSLRHTKAHMARAVLEGVTFSLRECLDLLCGLGQSCARVRMSGGGSRSALRRQMMADVFGTEVVEVNVTQGAAYGAALLAGVGTGVYPNAEQACERTVQETGTTAPGPNAGAYTEAYERYRALYPALAPEFKRASRSRDEQELL